MQNRAKFFMPFDALAGFREGLELACKKCNTNKKISEEMEYEINEKIKVLKKGDKVKVIYYYNIDYNEIIGNIKKIDNIYKELILDSAKITIDDILDIIKF